MHYSINKFYGCLQICIQKLYLDLLTGRAQIFLGTIHAMQAQLAFWGKCFVEASM